jgi:hypothetical protein
MPARHHWAAVSALSPGIRRRRGEDLYDQEWGCDRDRVTGELREPVDRPGGASRTNIIEQKRSQFKQKLGTAKRLVPPSQQITARSVKIKPNSNLFQPSQAARETAAAAMATSSLLVVGNSLRLRR